MNLLYKISASQEPSSSQSINLSSLPTSSQQSQISTTPSSTSTPISASSVPITTSTTTETSKISSSSTTKSTTTIAVTGKSNVLAVRSGFYWFFAQFFDYRWCKVVLFYAQHNFNVKKAFFYTFHARFDKKNKVSHVSQSFKPKMSIFTEKSPIFHSLSRLADFSRPTVRGQRLRGQLWRAQRGFIGRRLCQPMLPTSLRLSPCRLCALSRECSAL